MFIVGGLDFEVINLNKMAWAHLQNAKLELVEGATHLFEEPVKLAQVVKPSVDWLDEKLINLARENMYDGGPHVR